MCCKAIRFRLNMTQHVHRQFPVSMTTYGFRKLEQHHLYSGQKYKGAEQIKWLQKIALKLFVVVWS